MSVTAKLGIAAAIVAGVTGYMAYVGTAQSWKYYLTVDECLADAPSLTNQRMRVNGKVSVGSLDITEGRQRATFTLCGSAHELPVTCVGPLPDNLAEDMDVVVEGRLNKQGLLEGDRVLTRCASKYEAEAKTASAERPRNLAAEGRRR